MSGQSIVDRALAAKYTVSGSNVAKVVCKATTEEVMGPKRKHLDYLIHCTDDGNVSIPQMANLLIERTTNTNWVVVYKALITVHNLMNYGNERFTQYLASNNCHFNLINFTDRSGTMGYEMSSFIRRYARYLNQKASSYRQMAFDFCKVKRGKEDGFLRTMNTDQLLKALPVIHTQLEALVEFGATANDLTNGVVNGSFMLMFKDLIRLFACYNDGIINLLEKYFDMNKKQCKDALDVYKKFLARTDRVIAFLKVAEDRAIATRSLLQHYAADYQNCHNVGIDKGEIPDLAKAPSSLLDALEQHLAALETTKKTPITSVPLPTPTPMAGVSAVISSYATAAVRGAAPGAGTEINQISDKERAQILEEEQKQLELLKQQRIKQQQQQQQSSCSRLSSMSAPPTQSISRPSPTSPSPVVHPAPPTSSSIPSFEEFMELTDKGFTFQAPSSSAAPSNDLLELSRPTNFPPNSFISNGASHGINGVSLTDGFGSSAPWPASGSAFDSNAGGFSYMGGASAIGFGGNGMSPTTGTGGFGMAGGVGTGLGGFTPNNNPFGSSSAGMLTPTLGPQRTQNNYSDSFGGVLQPMSTSGGYSNAGTTVPKVSSQNNVAASAFSSLPPGVGTGMGTGSGGVVGSGMGGSTQNKAKLIDSSDIDTSLALIAVNLNVKTTGYHNKNDLQWKGETGEKKLTGGGGGMGWTVGGSSSTGGSIRPTAPQGGSAPSPWNQSPVFPPQNINPPFPMAVGVLPSQPATIMSPYGPPMSAQPMGGGWPASFQGAPPMQSQRSMSGLPPNDPFGAL